MNAGCGSKLAACGNWTNVDISGNATGEIVKCDLLNGLPFNDNEFDAVYHSHVLEHIPKSKSRLFISECKRVLKKNGIMRVVVPDLENIARTYLKELEACRSSPSRENEIRYDWILLEMYDQSVRNHAGGEMAGFLKKLGKDEFDCIQDRIGRVGREVIKSKEFSQAISATQILSKLSRTLISPRLTMGLLKSKIEPILYSKANKRQREIGLFRESGEIHYCEYDEFSLTRLFKEAGLTGIKRLDAHTSTINNWNAYELDVRNGEICDPQSLFMEASK